MRLSIATKVFLGFVAVLACSAAVSAYGVARLRRIGQGLSLLSRPYMPLTRAVSTLEAFHKERVRNTDRLLDEADPRARAGFIALDRTYFARVVGERLTYAQQLVGGAQQTASDRDALDRIAARLAATSARVAEEEKAAATLTARLEKGGSADASLEDAVNRLKTAQRRVDYEVRDLGRILQDQMNQGVDEAEKQERAARWAILALSGIALLVGLLVTWLSHRALRPIRTLTEAAQRLGRGSPDSVAVPEQGGDELAALAREFNAMAQRLAARARELRAQGEALLRSARSPARRVVVEEPGRSRSALPARPFLPIGWPGSSIRASPPGSAAPDWAWRWPRRSRRSTAGSSFATALQDAGLHSRCACPSLRFPSPPPLPRLRRHRPPHILRRPR